MYNQFFIKDYLYEDDEDSDNYFSNVCFFWVC